MARTLSGASTCFFLCKKTKTMRINVPPLNNNSCMPGIFVCSREEKTKTSRNLMETGLFEIEEVMESRSTYSHHNYGHWCANRSERPSMIHIRRDYVSQNGSSDKKCVTVVQGIPHRIELIGLLKQLKQHMCCSGCIKNDPGRGQIIQLRGDHRLEVSYFFLHRGLCEKEDLIVHESM